MTAGISSCSPIDEGRSTISKIKINNHCILFSIDKLPTCMLNTSTGTLSRDSLIIIN